VVLVLFVVLHVSTGVWFLYSGLVIFVCLRNLYSIQVSYVGSLSRTF
jgi:hypothetical protein